MNGDILMKLITFSHYQIHVIHMILRRWLGQRSRSASDGRRNLMNSIASGLLKRF